MLKLILRKVFVLGVLVAGFGAGMPGRAQTIEWIRQFGTSLHEFTHGVAVDSTGVYVVGQSYGTLPGQTSAGSVDPYIRKYDANGNELWTRQFGTVGAVFGSNLNDGSTVLFSEFAGDGSLVRTLGGSSVTLNGVPAPLFYSTPGQLGIQIPFELAGQTSATIVVTVGGLSSAPRTVLLDAFAPGIFTANQQGNGIAAVLHQDGITPVTAENPARRNEVLVFFGTGLGTLSPALETGARSVGNLTATAATATVDGVAATVEFSGTAPGFVGLSQVNVRIPGNTRTAASIPVVLRIGGKQSNTVSIPVAP